MKTKTVKELKEKIEAEVKEDYDFEQHLFKKYPNLFYTGEDGELLPQFQRCWNDCPKGWETIVDHLFGSIDNYIKNTQRGKINPNKKIKAWINEKMWKPINWKINAIFNPYKGTFVIRKFASPTPEQRAKIDAKFSMKVRRLTSKIASWFMRDLYIHTNPKQAKIAQYKEKFATLRIYADGGDDYVEGMIKFAEYLTSKTCQHTGEAGDLCKKGSWYATLSPKKAKQLGFSATKEQ
jgi:hypothetical protein